MPSGVALSPYTRFRLWILSERHVKMRPIALLRSSAVPCSRMKRWVWPVVLDALEGELR
jgi:hypothetical protein